MSLGTASLTPNRLMARRIRWATVAAAILLATLVILAIGADAIRPLDTRHVDLTAVLQPPSWNHPMGTDEVGRDLFARVLHGLRLSLLIGLLAALVAVAVGGTLGLIAGALGGRVDSTIMRFVDLFASMNHLLFGILLAVLFRPALGPLGAVLLSVGLTHWVPLARIVRAELLSLRERPFVAAAVNAGAGAWWLVRRHYVPHLVPAVTLGFVLLFPHAVFHETALSFLGLGLPPHQASLGNILADSRRSLFIGGWWVSFFPGLILFLASLAVGTVNEYLRDRLHPRWRAELEL